MSELVSIVIQDEVIFSKIYPFLSCEDICDLLVTTTVVREAVGSHQPWKFDEVFQASLASNRPAGQPPTFANPVYGSGEW